MSLRGLPDWHLPLLAGGAFAAYEQPDVWFTVPTRLEPAPGGYVVDRFALDPDSGAITRFGVHTLRWVALDDTAVVAVAGVTLPATPPRPLPVDDGVARLTGPAQLVTPTAPPPSASRSRWTRPRSAPSPPPSPSTTPRPNSRSPPTGRVLRSSVSTSSWSPAASPPATAAPSRSTRHGSPRRCRETSWASTTCVPASSPPLTRSASARQAHGVRDHRHPLSSYRRRVRP